MANRAAQLIAENSGHAVKRRGRHYVEFDLGGGVTRHVATIEPLHKRVDGTTEIDTTFVADTGAWQWKLASTDFQVNARSVLNAGDVVQWLDPVSGQSVILQPLALNWVDNATDSRQQITQPQAVTAIANDCTLYWPNGYGTGRHFRYTAHPKRLVKEFIVDAAANLPAPTVSNPFLEVEFIIKASSGVELFIDGAQWDRSTKTSTAHAIEFRVTATGQTAWLFEAPRAHDADGNTTPGIMQLRRQGANRYVTVRFPKAWIDGATFPIVLDPSFTDGYGGDVTTYKDDSVNSGSATYNYGASTYSPRNTYRGLMAFDVSSIASGSTCNSATYYGYQTNGSTDSPWTMTIYSIASGNAAWIEGTKNGAAAGSGEPCWDALAADGSGGVTTAWAGSAGLSTSGTDYEATAIGSFSGNRSDGNGTEYSAALTTSRVAQWFGTSNTNYGILLVPSATLGAIGSSDNATTSYRPKLVVDYTAGGGGSSIVPILKTYRQRRI